MPTALAMLNAQKTNGVGVCFGQGSLGRAALSRFSKISALTTQNKLWYFPVNRLLYGEVPWQSWSGMV